MKKNKGFIISVLCLILLAVSCDKDNDLITGNTLLLTNNSWDIYQVLGNGMDITHDAGNPFKDCCWDFYSDGTYLMTNGHTFNGTWEFNSSETLLILDQGTVDEISMDINVLSDINLELQYTYVDSGVAVILVIKCKPH